MLQYFLDKLIMRSMKDNSTKFLRYSPRIDLRMFEEILPGIPLRIPSKILFNHFLQFSDLDDSLGAFQSYEARIVVYVFIFERLLRIFFFFINSKEDSFFMNTLKDSKHSTRNSSIIHSAFYSRNYHNDL